jgi:hypothetical protein
MTPQTQPDASPTRPETQETDEPEIPSHPDDAPLVSDAPPQGNDPGGERNPRRFGEHESGKERAARMAGEADEHIPADDDAEITDDDAEITDADLAEFFANPERFGAPAGWAPSKPAPGATGFWVKDYEARRHLEALSGGETRDLRTVEFDLRRRLREHLPVVLERVSQVTGTLMTLNAFEAVLRQGRAPRREGFSLSPSALKLLLCLQPTPDAWNDNARSAVSALWADVIAEAV